MIVIVMGVSGCGKSTVGALLAERMRCEFLDADDFHSPQNVAKMRAGTPLTDDDRTGWLDALRTAIASRLAGEKNAVLACSALRETYRQHLRHAGEPIVFVHLRGSFDAISRRLAGRKGHYMSPSLLASQFATLEEPTDAIVVDVELSPDAAAAQIIKALNGEN